MPLLQGDWPSIPPSGQRQPVVLSFDRACLQAPDFWKASGSRVGCVGQGRLSGWKCSMIFTTPREEMLTHFHSQRSQSSERLSISLSKLKFDPQLWSHPLWAFPVLGGRATRWGASGQRPTGPALGAAPDGAKPQNGDHVMPLAGDHHPGAHSGDSTLVQRSKARWSPLRRWPSSEGTPSSRPPSEPRESILRSGANGVLAG